jgi:hypothetical protein
MKHHDHLAQLNYIADQLELLAKKTRDSATDYWRDNFMEYQAEAESLRAKEPT